MTYNTIGDAVTMQPGAAGALLAGRYRIVKQLGQGGMGSVWLAEDTQLDGKQFAIKMLPSILVSNKRAYRQLKDEALVAMQLVHHNIVQIRAFEENGGNPFLVMDYVDGQTLDDYLAEHLDGVLTQSRRVAEGEESGSRVLRDRDGGGGLPEEEVIRILKPIAAALDYAHGEGVVHRDVKPANVMIRKDGHPFILDFGIAREIQETMTRVTGKLSSGTLLYMSPEQLNGDAPKPAQDVYSFAAMVYECLKGEPPFVRGAIEDQIKNKVPESPVEASVPLARSVMSGLAKKPEDRPATCIGVLEWEGSRRAAETQSGRAVSMKPPCDAPATAESVGRDAPLVSHSLSGGRIAPQSGRDGSTSRPPNGRGMAIAVLALLAALGGGVWWWQARQDAVPASTGPQVPPVATTNAKPIIIDKPARQPFDESKVAATEIRIEAIVQKGKIERISDADGFREQKDDLAEVFARADTLFDAKVGRWGEAAQLFTNYLNRCKALIELDGERNAAVVKRTEAESARKRAKEADAEELASVRWQQAENIFSSASSEFERMGFRSAGFTFDSASKQFAKCEAEAGTERERQKEVSAAKEKADREECERRAKWRKTGEEFTINELNGLYMTMKWCPPGSFMMGSPTSEEGRGDDERQHRVTLTKGFWMGETEVTQGQWKKLMGGETVVDLARTGLQDDTKYIIGPKEITLRELWGMERYGNPRNRCGDLKDDVPVYNVSWSESAEFCRRLTQCESNAGRIPDGYEYRLPTEAEWEYACRAGTTTALSSHRDIRIHGVRNAPAIDDIAWYGGNSSRGFEGLGVDTSGWTEKQYPGGCAFAREVKSKSANAWGLYDMIGNVWEWCGDWYGAYSYERTTDPTGPATGTERVARGGSWSSIARSCRSAERTWYSPGLRGNYLGFRVALARCLNGDAVLSLNKESGVIGQTQDRSSAQEGQRQEEIDRHRRKLYPEYYTKKEARQVGGEERNRVQLWKDGPYWADRNIGAEKPEDYGYYFWWGDTVGYKCVNDAWVSSDGSRRGFSFEKENIPTLNKSSSTLRSEGWITVGGILAPEHDAAHVHWGGNWRIPTKQELSDLNNKCDWTWATKNGVKGYIVRGRGDYASNSIFLPCAGHGVGPSLYYVGSGGYYWSSVPGSGYYDAWNLLFYSGDHSTRYYSRLGVLSVRPVQGFTK